MGTWKMVWESNRAGYEALQFERAEVLRNLAGKYTQAETQQIAELAIDIID